MAEEGIEMDLSALSLCFTNIWVIIELHDGVATSMMDYQNEFQRCLVNLTHFPCTVHLRFANADHACADLISSICNHHCRRELSDESNTFEDEQTLQEHFLSCLPSLNEYSASKILNVVPFDQLVKQ